MRNMASIENSFLLLQLIPVQGSPFQGLATLLQHYPWTIKRLISIKLVAVMFGTY